MIPRIDPDLALEFARRHPQTPKVQHFIRTCAYCEERYCVTCSTASDDQLFCSQRCQEADFIEQNT